MCGGVTGGLITLGLFFGSENLQDYNAVGRSIGAARQFIPRFEERVGALVCPRIQEDVVFGRYMDPAASPENMEAFAKAQGLKCGLMPGTRPVQHKSLSTADLAGIKCLKRQNLGYLVKYLLEERTAIHWSIYGQKIDYQTSRAGIGNEG
jgi:hypothetical protein